MIARACRAFPGVLVSMLLAGPILASPALADTDGAARSAPLDHRRPSVGRAHKAAASPAPTKSAQTKPATAKSVRTAQARVRRPAPAARSVAFIDDGASYSETQGGTAWTQSGIASWYGGARWQGNRTSSGARYDENALTAAHATLPLGTRVRVALHNSARTVIVTITDRPGTRTRIIDLSRGAAAALGMLDQGVAMVTLSPL